MQGLHPERPVLVLGLARQGLEMVRWLAERGVRVTAADRRAIPLPAWAGDSPSGRVRFLFGAHDRALSADCQLLCLSAGVPPQLPLVQAAMARGIPIVNDTLLTLTRAPCPITLITGSSGKTTTTALTGALLRRGLPAPGRVHVGGNIGTPLLRQVHAMRREDALVWEASSFQLELFDPRYTGPDLEPACLDAVALLNVTPNHLDRHRDMHDYLRAKLRALHALRPQGTLILNADDPACQRLLPAPAARPQPWNMPDAEPCARELRRTAAVLRGRGIRILPFSLSSWLPQGVCLRGEWIWVAGHRTAPAAEFALRGRHNLGNGLAACALAHVHGVPPATMRGALSRFRGVPHRLEDVACTGGVTWINDSIATSPERAAAGIESVQAEAERLVLLAGGYDKNLPWGRFETLVVRHVHTLVTFGQAGPRIAARVKDRRRRAGATGPTIRVVENLDRAVRTARAEAGPGTAVLLSPGAASFDQYPDFEARGEHFRQLATSLET